MDELDMVNYQIDQVNSDRTICYIHFPMLNLADGQRKNSIGKIRRLSFDEFNKLDHDWARELYYNKAPRFIWECNYSTYLSQVNQVKHLHKADYIYQLGMMIYWSLIININEKYPDPRHSARYLVQDRSIKRYLGAFDRSYFLTSNLGKVLSNEESDKVYNDAEEWLKNGRWFDDDLFMPLNALTLIYSSEMPENLHSLPIMTALEGYLLGAKTQGIAKELAARAKRLIRNNTDIDIEKIIRSGYAWRSDIIHGRTIDYQKYIFILEDLKKLLSLIVANAIQLSYGHREKGFTIIEMQRLLSK